jgi:hypothetical protein
MKIDSGKIGCKDGWDVVICSIHCLEPSGFACSVLVVTDLAAVIGPVLLLGTAMYQISFGKNQGRPETYRLPGRANNLTSLKTDVL